MSNRDLPLVCVGTGFIALDILLRAGEEKVVGTFAGGTCANVVSILSFMGWKGRLIAEIGKDSTGDRVVRDLVRFGVDIERVRRNPQWRTPVVIETLSRSARGRVSHRFSFRCPDCGERLPKFRPLPVAAAEEMVPALNGADVFFFDRVSKSGVHLAEKAKALGKLVFFEPSSIRQPSLFKQAVAASTIVKYSTERLGSLPTLPSSPPLMIETLGSEGVRYRQSGQPWHAAPQFEVERVEDTVGAGDWFTAAFLQRIGRSWRDALARKTSVRDAVQYAQSYAAASCAYPGARGAMYATTLEPLAQLAERIRSGASGDVPAEHVAAKPGAVSWCLECSQ